MAVTVITQKPLYNEIPVGSEIIFTVANDTAVANEVKVKFCVGIYISNSFPANTAQTSNLIGTFKTTPNNAGVGMFNLSNILENYVKADNMANNLSSYKGTATTSTTRHPIHIIDKYSMQKGSFRYVALEFYVEYLQGTSVSADMTTAVPSEMYTVSNGYLKHTDILDIINIPFAGVNIGDFGFNLTNFSPSTASRKYLTNAPTTQYANSGDYGTLAINTPNATAGNNVYDIDIDYFDDAGSISSQDTITRNATNGAYATWGSHVQRQMLFFGCFPANLENWSANYATAVTAGLTYYTIKARKSSGAQVLKTMTIRLNCPNTKGYESIRLCWLNQWGAWDYYTFTKKSVINTSTQGTTYTQLAGSWNSSRYRLDSYKGGKKAFRVNATEKITMNTGFVAEDDNVMFEELINSPEVYLLDGFQTDGGFSALNNYVTPVRVTTSSFTRKTSANDRLLQYTFEIEKSNTLRTQSI